MNIKIKATSMELTPAISEYLHKRMEAVTKFIDADSESLLIEAELGKTSVHHRSGDVFRAEVNLSSTQHHVRAVAETEDLYASIDKVKDQLLAELRAIKEKRQHFLKRGGQKIKNIIKGIIK